MESNMVKIKDLPRVEEVLPGDLLIVEDQQGSKAIDFRDFVVGPENTSFFNGLATNITAVSTFSHSLCSTVAINNNQTIRSVQTTVSRLTAGLLQRIENRVPNIYDFSQSVIFGSEAKAQTITIFAPVNNVRVSDFIINMVDPPARLTPRTFSIKLSEPTDVSQGSDTPLFQYTVGLSALPAMSQIPGGTDVVAQEITVRVLKYY
jgi:hypothetical protein